MIDDLYTIVESQYFDSGAFKGMPLYGLVDLFDVNSDKFREVIQKAISDEILEARFHGNTHIKAFSNLPKEKQLEWLRTEEYPGHICLYPHPNRLHKSEKLEKYKNAPYERELALGGGQLDFRTFDLSVLEYYRNDPRYSYWTDDIHGQICIEDSFYKSGTVPLHDQILLQTFGFAYDDDLNRYVAVFLRYLANLSPEHQNIWQAKEVKGDIKLHPDYYASSIEGSWGTRIPIFEAFVQELEIINKMCSIMGKPNIFRNTYTDERPKEFGFLLRPTESEFNNFMLLLDKMMSDNINKKFFEGDIELELEEERDDGKIVVSQKGTIQLLETWIKKYFRPVDNGSIDNMIKTFKKVRKLRQKPAHKVSSNTFDQTIFKHQRDIVVNAYDAVRTLRLILANHPSVRANPPEIDEQLFKGEIWDI